MKYRKLKYYAGPITVSRREQDHQQVQRILAGEEALWEPLYEEARAKVLWAARSTDYQRLLSEYEYQEITDEAFMRCYVQLDRYEGRSRFAYWVCGYARNLTRNRCSRRLTQLRNQKLLEDAARDRGIYCDPLWIMIRLEREECFWAAFFALESTDREILSQRILYQTAPKVLARSLKLTRREVIQRYEDARWALRRKFMRLYCNGIQP